MSLNIPLIALEEHVFIQSIWDNYSDRARRALAVRDPLVHIKLLDADDGRITAMDLNSVHTQVLSHIPCHASRQEMVKINNELQAMKTRHPERYQCFTSLSLADPEFAAGELERCVAELGFVGAMVPNTLADGTFYDTPNFYPFYSKAEELGVPIYIHPIFPTEEVNKCLFDGPYSKAAAIQIGTWCYGWHAGIAIHILRLFAAGIFDRFPKIKIVIGHMGETLPFMLDRIIPQTRNWPEAAQRRRELRQVWDENIWITTSGMFTIGPMACLLRTTKVERILYSVDYPLEDNADGLRFMTELRESGLVNEEEFHKIAHKNAKSLLHI